MNFPEKIDTVEASLNTLVDIVSLVGWAPHRIIFKLAGLVLYIVLALLFLPCIKTKILHPSSLWGPTFSWRELVLINLPLEPKVYHWLPTLPSFVAYGGDSGDHGGDLQLSCSFWLRRGGDEQVWVGEVVCFQLNL